MCYSCSRPVANVSLSMVTEADQSAAPAVIQTQSQAFWLPAPCSSSSSCGSMVPEPAAKRSRQHSDLNVCRLAVTAVTRLTPLLNSACVKCSVMLHYIQKQDAFALVSGSIPHVLHCGEVAFDIEGDFQSRLLRNPQLKTGKKKKWGRGQDLKFDTMFLIIPLFMPRWGAGGLVEPGGSAGPLGLPHRLSWLQLRRCGSLDPETIRLSEDRTESSVFLRWVFGAICFLAAALVSEQRLPGGTVCPLQVNIPHTYSMALVLLHSGVWWVWIPVIAWTIIKQRSEVEHWSDYITCSCCCLIVLLAVLDSRNTKCFLPFNHILLLCKLKKVTYSVCCHIYANTKMKHEKEIFISVSIKLDY